jgi:plastocyanin
MSEAISVLFNIASGILEKGASIAEENSSHYSEVAALAREAGEPEAAQSAANAASDWQSIQNQATTAGLSIGAYGTAVEDAINNTQWGPALNDVAIAFAAAFAVLALPEEAIAAGGLLLVILTDELGLLPAGSAAAELVVSAVGKAGTANALATAFGYGLHGLVGIEQEIIKIIESLMPPHDHSHGPGGAGAAAAASGRDPIIIDLTGNGINILNLSQSAEQFDYSGNGFSIETAWAGTGNGFLVIRSNNPAFGVSIGDGYELLGTGSESGFQVLQSLISNSAGTISAEDALYSQLGVWQNTNGDGVAQVSEISSLGTLGIQSISLDVSGVNEVLDSATITGLSSVTMANGQVNQIAEVNLETNSVYSQYTGTYTSTPQIEALPDVKGYGLLPDLQIEMSFDPTLTAIVQNLVASPPSTVSGYDQAVQNIMYQWANVENVSPATGNLFDGQKVDFLQSYVYGSDRFSTNPSVGPAPWFIGQAIELNASWNDAFDEVEARLLVQTNTVFQQSFAVWQGTDLLMPVSNYAAETNIIQNNPSVNISILDYISAIQNIEENTPANLSSSVTYWVQALNVISQSVGDDIQSGPIDTAGLIAAVGAGVPFFISNDVLDAAISGTLTYIEMSALNNVVYGTSGTDLFDVSQSNMTIEGFGGGDEIIVNPGVANLNINEVENNPAHSNALFFAAGIGESNIVVSGDASGNIVLTYDAKGDQVTLDSMLFGPTSGSEQGPLHTSLPYTSSTEFGVQEVIFSDGTTWTASQVISMLQDNGSPVNTTLYSGAEGATFNPEGYANLIIGHGGADTILYNEGYGNITIDENNASGAEQSVLQFGSGVSSGEILASGDASGDLILTLGTSGSQIKLAGMNASSSDGVAEAIFADGTTLTAAQLLAGAGIGSPENTVLYANRDTSLLDPAGYAHAVVGARSGDTIEYNEGDGGLTISQSNGSPVLAFGSSVSEANIVVAQDGQGDIILTDLATGATIDLAGMASNGSEIAAATFSDGTTWSAAQILEKGDIGNIYNRALYAEAGYNVFDPNGYAHYVQGNSNGYTVLYNLGDGNLTVSSPAYAGILQFGAGISAADISLSTTGNGAVVLTVGSTGSQITLANQLYGTGVDEITFADGSAWSLQQILTMADTGSADNTVLYGEPDNNTVIDPAGYAHVVSLWGPSSTILYNVGYGKLTIVAGGEFVPTTLVVGPGITASDISVTNINVNPDPQYQWAGFFALNIGTQAAEIVIDNFYGSGYAPGFGQIDFSDGTTLSASDIANLANTGNALNTTLAGTSRLGYVEDNLFDPKGFAHEVVTNGEPSTILYDTGYGALQVYGDANTTLQFAADISEAEVSVSYASSIGLILNVGTGADQITLENGGHIGAVEFADGTTWTAATLLQLADTGSYHGQTLTPDASSNVFNPNGYATEILSTLSGSDTILYDHGYGSLTVDVETTGYSSPYWWSPRQYYPNGDVLQFGTGITASEISVDQDASGGLVIHVGNASDVITLTKMASESPFLSMTSSPQYGVASAIFADGTTLTAQQLVQLSETGSAENSPTLTSAFTGTTFYTNGYVSEVNGAGGDTIVYGANGGDLVINESYKGGFPSSAVLQLGTGISEADVQLATDSNGDVILQIGSAADQITLGGMNYALAGLEWGDYGVGSIVFADGTTWTSTSIASMLQNGSSFNNQIYAFGGGETFDSKGVATYISDYDNNGDQIPNAFLYNAGYGQLTIATGTDTWWEDSQNILQFGSGIDPAAVTVLGDASGDIILTDGVQGDSIVVQGMLDSASNGMGVVQFADGTTWSASQILAKEDIGSSQSTTLYAGYEPNVFDPSGFAHLIEDNDNSTILYNLGYGNLEIQPELISEGGSGASGGSGGFDQSAAVVSGNGNYAPDNSTLIFGESISLSDLSFELNGQGAVVVTVGADNAQITLDNALEVGTPSFVFADGTTLTSDQIVADAEANVQATTITGPGAVSVTTGYGFSAASYGTFVNSGTIVSSNNEGVYLRQGGQITNNGVIYGADGGIYQAYGSNSVIINSGSILAGAGTNASHPWFSKAGIDAYGTVLNSASGLISGVQYGIYLWSNYSSISNAGSIGATSGTGVRLWGVGTVYNTGIITGGASGAGVAFNNGAALSGDGGTLIDSGLISGGTAAVYFGGSYSRLVVEAGATFSGQVVAKGTGNVLELAAGAPGVLDMGGSFSGFQTIVIDPGASWTLEGTSAELEAGQTIIGLTNADTIEILSNVGVSGGTLIGGTGADTLAPGGVYGVILGQGGADTILYDSTYGALYIQEYSYSGPEQSVLQFSSDVSAASLTISGDNNGDVLVTVGSTADLITLAYMLDNPFAGVSEFVFADGSTLSAAQITADAQIGSAQNTTLYADGGTNTLVPNGYATSVQDFGGGKDTILYGTLDGNLNIDEQNYSGPEESVLQFGTGISEGQVSVARGANGSLVLTIESTGKRITLDGMAIEENPAAGQYQGYGVAAVIFADGTTLSARQLVDMTNVGSPENVVLTPAGVGSNTFDPNGYAYLVEGSGLADTIFYNAGYGNVTIDEPDAGLSNSSYPATAESTLVLGAGITESDVLASEDSVGDVILQFGTAGGEIVLTGEMPYPGGAADSRENGDYGVGSIVFSDGTTWAYQQIIDAAATGSPYDTVLKANGDNIVDPNGYAHYVWGYGGSSTILYNQGYGNLEINNKTPGTLAQDILSFGTGISESDVSIVKDGNNIYLHVAGTGNGVITLDSMDWNWQLTYPSGTGYGVGDAGIGSVTFADGTSWNQQQIFAESDIGSTNNTNLTANAGDNVFDPNGFAHEVTDLNGGADTIVYDAGYGNLVVDEANAAGAEQTVLQFGSNISEANISFTTDAGGDVLLSLTSTGTEITLGGMANSTDQGLGSIVFSDGTTLSAAQILAAAQTGQFGETVLYGGAGQSTLDPAGFVHNVGGGTGDNVILYNAGYGDLTIKETAASAQQSVLQFGSGISASDIGVVGDAAGDIILTVASLGTQITLSGMLTNSLAGIGSLAFADGTSLTALQLVDMAETGSPTNLVLYGNAYGAELEPNGPVHLINLGTQANSIDYETGDGNLTINGTFATGASQPGDILAFGTGISASDLSASTPDGSNLILTVGTSSSRITLSNMLVSGQVINSTETLNYGVSEVTFTDGTTLSSNQVIALLDMGSHLNTTLNAGSGDNSLDPAGYAHVINGNGGTDTILYNRGYGNLLINEQNTAGTEQSVLELGSSIVVADIAISGDAQNDILLADTVTGAQITLASMLDSGANGVAYGVGSVVFDSVGTTLTAAELIADAETGTANNTTLYAGAGNTTFQTNGYAQVVNGNGGADTILYTPSAGNLQINEYNGSGAEQSVLQFGSGVSASDLSIFTDGYGDVVVQVGTTGAEIGLTDMLSGSQYGVGSFVFADGTTLTASQIEAGLATIAAANTTLYATLSSETLDTKGYFDAIQGNGGADTIIYNPGYGNLSITEQSYPDPEQSVLQFGAGISETDVAVSQDNSGDIILGIGSPAAQITLVGMLESDLNGVAAVEFSDGTTWTAAQIIAKTETGSPEHTTLVAGPGNNVFDPNGYAHVVDGNGGADTILFNLGYGTVTINEENASGPEQSVLQFGAGITAADISVSQDTYGDIILTVGTAGDAVVLSNMIETGLDGISFGIGSATFVDGTTLSAQQITNLAETGSAGNTILRAGPDGDMIDPNGYAHLVLSGSGTNTILYNQGYGALTINEQAAGGTEASVLQFGSGISAANLSATTDNAGDVILTIDAQGDQITLTSMANSVAYGIGEAIFADGTTLSAAEIDTLAATPTTISSSLTGYATSLATTDEAAVTPFASLAVTDGNAGTPLETITVSLSNGADGSLYDPNAKTDGSVYDNGILTLTGSAAEVSTILDALVFTPAAHQVALGDTVITTLTVTDVNSVGLASSAAVTVSATAVNDPPVISGAVTAQVATDEKSVTPFSSIVITDPDFGANETVTITVTGADGLPTNVNGTLAGTGLTEVSAGVYTLVAGAPPSLTAELEDLTFAPAVHQAEPGGTVTTGFTITVAQNEAVTTNTATSIITTATNDPPVITGTQAGEVTSDEAVLNPFSGVTVSDPDLGVTETATIVLTSGAGLATDANGALSGTGLTKTGVGTYSLAAGAPAELTAELEALQFAPAAHQVSPGQTVTTGFTLAVTQVGLTSTDSLTSVTATAVNDAPVISGTSGGQATTDEASLNPFANAVITDLDFGVTDSLLITLTGTGGVATDADGTLSGAGLTEIAIGVYSLSAASPSSLTAELEALTFTTTAHQVAPGNTVVTDFTVAVTQNGLTTTDTVTSVIATAVNDAPVIAGALSAQPAIDTLSLDPFSTVTITDPDIGVVDSVLITLTGTNNVATDADGTLAGAGLSKLGAGLYSLSAVSPASLTAELEALTFTPTPHQVAPGDIVVTEFDLAVTQNGLTTVNTLTSVIATASAVIQIHGGTLYGLESGLTLDPAGTLHVVNAGSYADTILYDAGYGAVTIEDANPAGTEQSVLQFGSGISEGALKVSADTAGDIILTDGISGDTITLTGMNSSLDDGVGSIQFADGTSWSASELIELATLQSAGTVASDYGLEYGTGARTVSGAGVFVIGAGIAKSDVIFESNNSNGNLSIALLGADGQPSGDSITITGYWWNEKGQATVLFPDGSALPIGNQVVNTWIGSATQTTLVGSNFSPNLFDLGLGGDRVTLGATYNGGNGQNTLKFGYGDGPVTVTPNNASATIAFGTGILPSNVAFQSSNGNGNLSVELLDANGQPTGDSLTIDGYWWNTSGTNLAVFANGTTLAINHQLTETWIGTKAQTTLVGSNFAPNLFDLGPGGDRVTLGASYNGGNGQNTLEFGYGDGAVTVTPNQGSATIAFGADIAPSDVIFESNNNNGNLTIELLDANGQPTGDSMTIDGYWWNSTGTSRAVFGNGTTLALNHDLTETWVGSATQTSLVGSNFTPNVFDLGAGGDQVTLGANYNGGSGQNIVNFGTGDGAATISGYGGSATVNLAAGINLADITLSTDSGGNIILALADGTDSLVAAGAKYSSAFQKLDFANGTVLSESQILYMAETGTTGNDTITVPSGPEVIDGRGGNDVINGGNGYDTYLYRQGYGDLNINDAAGGGTVANGELDFGPGITEQDLWFSQSGENLDVNVLGSQSQIVVANWFGGNAGAQLSEIKAYGGAEIDSGLNQLVAAMAVFEANNPAFNPETALQTPNDPNLLAALAATWHQAA